MATDRMIEHGINYLGRVEFGDGSIDATQVPTDEFVDHLRLIQSEAMTEVGDYKQVYGGCMDGRTNVSDELGGPVTPRPKVIGGPSGFAWYVAAIGGFSLLRPGMTPMEQFTVVNQRLTDAGFKLGMHYECGGARAPGPITEHYATNIDGINGLIGSEAKELVEIDNGRHISVVKHGLEDVMSNLARYGGDFTEEAMHAVVRELSGPEALIHLATDHDHPTHGHEEDGLAFIRRHGFVVNKDKVTTMAGRQIFYQNTAYAKALIEALAHTQDEYERGVIIGDQLPLAGVATLGRGQHVGEITDLAA